MKSFFYTLLFTLIFSNAFGQKGDNYIQLSHTITTETKAITGFDKIDVKEDFEVFIRFSDTEEKVEIEANENLHDLIQVENEGGTLKIYTKSYSTRGLINKAEEKLVAYITVKTLKGIKGDEDVLFVLEDKLVADDLAIHLDEDSTLKGDIEVNNLSVLLDEDSVLKGSIKAENLSVVLDEDSELDIEGDAQTMNVKAHEDSIINSFDFTVKENLSIDLSDESEAKLTVNGNINLKASGESSFYYKGDGNFISKRLRGDSEVKTW